MSICGYSPQPGWTCSRPAGDHETHLCAPPAMGSLDRIEARVLAAHQRVSHWECSCGYSGEDDEHEFFGGHQTRVLMDEIDKALEG